MLSRVTELLLCGHNSFSDAVVAEASTLVLLLLDRRMHESDRPYERRCRKLAEAYLKIGCQPDETDLETVRSKMKSAGIGRSRLVGNHKPATIAEFLGCMLALPSR